MTDKPNRPTNPQTQNDAELLRRFHVQQDQAAFTALVEKYAPLVMGVCRRVLRDVGEAEDCFQRVFLTLALKGQSIRNRDSFVGWLFTVAHREAVSRYQQRDRNRNVRLREELMQDSGEHPSAEDHELATALQEEISQLPDKYQGPIVFCYLEGRSREETARELGVTDSSVKARLERGRNLLRKRLLKRGLVYSTALAAWQSTGVLSAGTISSGLIAQTVAFSATKAAAVSTGLVSSSTISSIKTGVLNIMSATKPTSIFSTAVVGVMAALAGVVVLFGLSVAVFLSLKEEPNAPVASRGAAAAPVNPPQVPAPPSEEVEYPAEFADYEPWHRVAATFLFALQHGDYDTAMDLSYHERLSNEGLQGEDRMRADLVEISEVFGTAPISIAKIYLNPDETKSLAITEEKTLTIKSRRLNKATIEFSCSLNENGEWRVNDIDFAGEGNPSHEIPQFMREFPEAKIVDVSAKEQGVTE